MAMMGGCTWNTVRQDCGKVSKWDRDPELSENFPPKICIPNREKIKMNRKRITSRELMDEMELTSDLTKLPIEAQYLENGIRLLAAVMEFGGSRGRWRNLFLNFRAQTGFFSNFARKCFNRRHWYLFWAASAELEKTSAAKISQR